MSDEEKVVSLRSAKENKGKEKDLKVEETPAFEPVYCSFCGR